MRFKKGYIPWNKGRHWSDEIKRKISLGNTKFTPEERFWSHVKKTTGCWISKGEKGRGYGRIRVNGKDVYTHRFSYELLVGPIPTGLTIDHLCRNRACVNPDHLEPVTRGENTLRGIGISAINARKTHCPQGHPYSGDNLIIKKKGGSRVCRICANEIHMPRYRAKNLSGRCVPLSI